MLGSIKTVAFVDYVTFYRDGKSAVSVDVLRPITRKSCIEAARRHEAQAKLLRQVGRCLQSE